MSEHEAGRGPDEAFMAVTRALGGLARYVNEGMRHAPAFAAGFRAGMEHAAAMVPDDGPWDEIQLRARYSEVAARQAYEIFIASAADPFDADELERRAALVDAGEFRTHEQVFGHPQTTPAADPAAPGKFTWGDVGVLRKEADQVRHDAGVGPYASFVDEQLEVARVLDSIADRIAALLPPREL